MQKSIFQYEKYVLWILNAPLHPGKIYKSIKAFILNNINPQPHSQSDEMRLMGTNINWL